MKINRIVLRRKHQCFGVLAARCSLCILLLFAINVGAQTKYSFTSPILSTLLDDTLPVGLIFDGTEQITGYMVLSESLTTETFIAGEYFGFLPEGPTLVDFMFTDGRETWTLSNTPYFGFRISADNDGDFSMFEAIFYSEDLRVPFTGFNTTGGQTRSIAMNNFGSESFLSECAAIGGDGFCAIPIGNDNDVAINFSIPGVWTIVENDKVQKQIPIPNVFAILLCLFLMHKGIKNSRWQLTSNS